MKKRVLGNSGIEVSPVGLGCMGFSHAYGKPMNEQEAIDKIRKAYEMGYTFFDTAECYTGTNADGSTNYNEELVGKALKDVRDKVVIATKFGIQIADGKLLADSSPETIRKSVEGSLKRLGTDYIDLYYQHRMDDKVEPEVVAGVMKELMEEGKIKAWGISEANEDYIRRAHAVCPVSAIQNRYSMLARQYEDLFPVLEELNIAYVAFSPMANGFLSGAYKADDKFEKGTDFRSSMPQYTKEGFESAAPLFKTMHELHEKTGASLSQLSLAWMLNEKDYIIPIPGSRNLNRMEENLHSADYDLTKEEMQEINDCLDQIDPIVYGGMKSESKNK